jgi:hypothetical protein
VFTCIWSMRPQLVQRSVQCSKPGRAAAIRWTSIGAWHTKHRRLVVRRCGNIGFGSNIKHPLIRRERTDYEDIARKIVPRYPALGRRIAGPRPLRAAQIRMIGVFGIFNWNDGPLLAGSDCRIIDGPIALCKVVASGKIIKLGSMQHPVALRKGVSIARSREFAPAAAILMILAVY